MLSVAVEFYSIVQSLETVVAVYAQQLPLNENQTFSMPSLTLVAELVSARNLLAI